MSRAETVRSAAERPLLFTVAVSAMLAPLNSTMIAVALPGITRDLGADSRSGGLLVTSYLIAMACLQPVAGKMGDRLGRRPMILGGLAWFAVASVGAAVSGSFPMLFAFRLQQGIAGALTFPNGSALIREVVPVQRRASRIGIVGSAIGFAAGTGPPLGGLLVSIGGWRAIFLVNLLLVAPAMMIGFGSLPRVVRTTRTHPSKPFDLVGSLALSGLLVTAAGALSFWRSLGPAFVLVVVAGIGAGFMLFLRRELSHPDPILQPRFFARPAFAGANAAVALTNLSMYTTLLVVPQVLEARGGWTPLGIGLVLTALAGSLVVVAPVGGRLADRLGRRTPVIGGVSLFTCGLLPLALYSGEVPGAVFVMTLAIAGVGLGLSSAGMQTAALEAVPARHAGVASGTYSTSRYLGSIVGSSLLAGLAGGPGGYRPVFVMIVAAAAAAVLASAVLPRGAGAGEQDAAGAMGPEFTVLPRDTAGP
ncbi:MAG TPA: MFS transporter [Actinomycetota bacterium]|nr:MFS transporter [Actinomycetota bacterium]